jgi:hypothetical protein
MTPQRRRDLRNDFLYWWPVIARIAGLAGAFGFGGFAALTHSAPDAGILGFCGALILVPSVMDVQDRRNGKRESRR